MTGERLLPFGGIDLARRLEGAEAQAAAGFANTWASRNPDAKSAVIEAAGGVAAFAGVGSPLSHAVGAGMKGVIDQKDWERLESFYRSWRTPILVDVCPFADASLIQFIGDRPYRITEFNNVLVRTVVDAPSEQPANVRIAGAESKDEWGRTVARGFFERDSLTAEEVDLTSVLAHSPATTVFLAVADGEPAAAAGMSAQNGVALFFGDATLTRFRRRGLHSALIGGRLFSAREKGCDLAMAETLPGSESQRNYERLGFRVAYTKLFVVREAD